VVGERPVMALDRTPFEALKEANRRARSTVVETPFDFLRMLNRERAARTSTRRILRRVARFKHGLGGRKGGGVEGR